MAQLLVPDPSLSSFLSAGPAPRTPGKRAPRDSCCQHQPPPRTGWADSAAGGDTSRSQLGEGRRETGLVSLEECEALTPSRQREGACGGLRRRMQDGAL